MTLCILGSKNNRKRREFLLIVSQGVADTIYAVAFMLIAIHRLRLERSLTLQTEFHLSVKATFPPLFLHDISTPLLGLVPMAMSVNFLISSVIPLWYMTARTTYTSALILVPYSLTFLLLIINYLLLWDDQTPTSALCIASNGAAHPVSYGVMLGVRILVNLSSAAVYVAIVMYLSRSHGRSLQSLSSHQKKTHRNAKITLGMVTFNSMALLCVPDILLLINPFNITQKYSTILYSMTLSKTTINFLIYATRYREIRGILFRSIFGRIPIVKNRLSELSNGKRQTRGGQSQAGIEASNARAAQRLSLNQSVML
ncbi:unnamed protein product [Heligmosomoides polygyrus]|uniref:G-protein coupled receptors family 1 profile domain-containing protein n=1 Tax=Heligmosomoides polygyrus TaxID=6339 RepID=A0A3P8B811_HELPZ|nr:unnamed protein product [Heligmosomoides polygyrus]